MSGQLEDRPRLAVDVGPHDHVRGPASAPLTLVEYGDYQCPFCGAAHPVVEQVERILGDELRFVFRHFPLTRIHPQAFQAAEAAEAAAAQGAFWEMHDQLLVNQKRLRTADLLGYARALGLYAGRVEADLRERVHEARVRADFLGGVQSGVNGTPTFFINGLRHNGAHDVDTLVTSLRAERAATRVG